MSAVEKDTYGKSTLIEAGKRFGSSNPPGSPLNFGSGGGTFDGMEARVAVLEAHVAYIREDVVELKADVKSLKNDMVDVKVGLATLSERMSHLPSKGFIVKSLMISGSLLSGLMALIGAFIAFQDHIRAFFAH